MRATLGRMTEFKPLEYAAALAVFLMIVAYAAAYQWSALFRTQGRLIYAAPWQVLMYLAGAVVGLSVWVAEKLLWGVYCLMELWCTPLADAPWRTIQSIWRYQGLRAHRPQHAV